MNTPFLRGRPLALGCALATLACQPEARSAFSPPPTPPAISVAPDSLAYTAAMGGSDPATRVISVNNLGGGTLDSLSVSAITYAAGQPTGWLAAAASGSPPTVSVQPGIGGLAAGNYSARITLSHPTASNSPVTVPVTLGVTALPVLGLSTRQLRYAATPGQTSIPPQLVNLTNAGAGNLTGLNVGAIQYAPGGPIGWLSASLSGTTAPAVLSVTANAGSLAAGAYSATVPVNAPGAAISPELVVVTITVSSAPVIALSAVTTTYTAVAGGASPAGSSVSVTNGGGGTLGGLSLGTPQYGAGANGWLTATLAGATAPTSVALSTSIASLPAGTYTVSIPVMSSDTTITPVGLNVRLTLTSPPAINFSAGTVNFTALTGGQNPASQSVLISNGGTGTLSGLSRGTITYGPGASGWLTATLQGTTAPASLQLSVNAAGLAQGIFSATVPVSSSVPGVTTQILNVTVAVAANAPAAIVGLNGNNQVGTIGSPLPLTIRARVLNSASNPFPGAPVTWTPGQGGSVSNVTTTTDANGEVIATWTLGSGTGTQTLTVQSPGVPSFNFSATAVPLPVSGRPNEPPGFTTVVDRPFNAKVELGWLDVGGSGFHIVADPTAPQSLPTIGEAAFPLGFTGGRGPMQTDFDTSNRPNHIYLAFWIKLSPNWDGHSSYVNKVIHIWINRSNRVYLTLTGTDTLPFSSRIALQGVNENPVSRNLNGNSGNNAKLQRGRWYLWEVELQSNTPGQPDGEARWWIDGVLQGDHRNINYVGVSNQGTHWETISWNPTWGGTGDIVPATQYMWIDNIYLSEE